MDLVLEQGKRYLPIEVKASSSLRVEEAKGIEAFCAEFPEKSPFGIVLYDGEEVLPLTRRSLAVPLGSVM